jgi:hypothetical protein
MITAYSVKQNVDLTEGRGPVVTKAIFLHEEDAQEFAKTLSGVMGTRQGVEIELCNIFEELYECKSYQKDVLRQQALRKLSNAEKEALGLS